jgi:nucleoid-associated protein YgaU
MNKNYKIALAAAAGLFLLVLLIVMIAGPGDDPAEQLEAADTDNELADTGDDAPSWESPSPTAPPARTGSNTASPDTPTGSAASTPARPSLDRTPASGSASSSDTPATGNSLTFDRSGAASQTGAPGSASGSAPGSSSGSAAAPPARSGLTTPSGSGTTFRPRPAGSPAAATQPTSAANRPATLSSPPTRPNSGTGAPGSASTPGATPRTGGSSTTSTTGSTTASTYTIQAGDSLYVIAQREYGNGELWDEIAQANPSVDPLRLRVGQTLRMPPRSEVISAQARQPAEDQPPRPGQPGSYEVQSGDSLSRIAQRFYGDPTMADIIWQANRSTIGSDPDQIVVGMRLTIPPDTRPNAQRRSSGSGGGGQ